LRGLLVTIDARNILVIGGLVGDANSAALFGYALGLARSASPAVGFIGTASGDSPLFVQRFYETFRSLLCRPSHLPLFDRTPDVHRYVASLDVVLVGGGNIISMLGTWRAWGLAEELTRAWTAGTVLVGWSAGAICWFEFGWSDSHAERFEAVPGLGLLPGSCCPHYSQDTARRDEFHRVVRQKQIPKGWGIDGGAAIHFQGSTPSKVLAPAGTRGACFVSADEADTAPIELARVEVP
jgi:peptidase E